MAINAFSVDALPDLVLQDGNVVIHTSDHPSGIWVVHKHVLVENSGYFRDMLNEEWGNEPRAVAGPDAPRIYEMDLQFDLEINLALPVILRHRVETDDEDQSQLVQQDALSRHTGRIFRSQPQPIPPNRPSQWHPDQTRRIYRHIIEQAHSSTMPFQSLSRSRFNPRGIYKSLQPREWTQKEVVDWSRKTFHCLLVLMYGHEISLPASHDRREHVILVADLLAYSRVLGLPESIEHQIGRMLMSKPDIWANVYEEPVDLFHLAYHLKLPHLYWDATKHVVARSHDEHGLHDSLPVRRLPIGERLSHCCNEEMSAILMAGRLANKHRLPALLKRILQSGMFQQEHWIESRGEWWYWPFSEDVPCYVKVSKSKRAKCVAALKDIFCQEVLPALVDDAENSDSVQAFGRDFRSPLDLILWLGKLGELDALPQDIKEGLRLYDLEKRLRLDANKLACVANRMLKECATVAREAEQIRYCRTVGECVPLAHCKDRGCLGCCQPKYAGESAAASLNAHTLYDRHTVKPWPLNGELREEKQAECTERVELVQASYRYIQSIGLGVQLGHLEARGNKLRDGGTDV